MNFPRLLRRYTIPALAQAVVWCSLLALLLRLYPLRRVLRIVERWSVARCRGTHAPTTTQISTEAKAFVWAIPAAARRVPGATCLVQAIAGRVMLCARGVDSALRIGVAPNGTGQLTAHAWVEVAGRPVIGGAESPRRYTVLPELPTRPKAPRC